MRTSPLVQWLSRHTGLVAVVVATVCAGRLVRPVPADAARARRARDGAAAAPEPLDWRARWPDLAAATRAGTWGEGGRDY